MDLKKLKTTLNAKKTSSNMTLFGNLLCVDIGVEPKIFYPKKKDYAGNKVLDEQGKEVRSEVSSGYTHTFVELQTARIVKVVLPSKISDFDLLDIVIVQGYGYDIKQSNLVFIQEKGAVKRYE